MGKKVYRLTEEEAEIIVESANTLDFNRFLAYWTGGEFARPIQFDAGFLPEGQWQCAAAGAAQKNIIALGGVGTGKTTWVAFAPIVFAAWLNDFRFYNLGPKLRQADLAREMILSYVPSRLGKLISRISGSPVPLVKIEFEWPNGKRHSSMLRYGSLTRGADGLMGIEADWINIDEAFQLDSDLLSSSYSRLATRLRGKTMDGRERMGRFSMTTNPWDNPFGWYLVYLAKNNPKEYLFYRLSTLHNKNITDEQVRSIVSKIPKDQRAQFINGERPVGTGNFFTENAVIHCQNDGLLDLWKSAGVLITHDTLAGIGTVEFAARPSPGDSYVMVADFGTGNAPYRNAPVITVWNVSRRPVRMEAFWWGQGNKSQEPLVSKYFEYHRLYRPGYAGVDASGTQRSIAELMMQIYKINGYDMVIYPIDSSPTGNKGIFLSTLRTLIETGALEWPTIDGIRAQLLSYRLPDTKIPQDIVMTMAMSAAVINGMIRSASGDEIAHSILESRGAFGAFASARESQEARSIASTYDVPGKRSDASARFPRNARWHARPL